METEGLAVTEIQKITLRDILTTAGLTPRQVEDVFLLLRFKPERVQMIFYYRSCGETQHETAEKVGCTQNVVYWHLNNSLEDVRKYIDDCL